MFGCSYYLMQDSFFTTPYSRCSRSSFFLFLEADHFWNILFFYLDG
ncbi:hypothetical protein HMPREF1352_00878 [Enterococcus faecium 511]|nr:hypothetical protein HMPREF1372_01900 [Enterococcus faecium P1139]EJY31857.1 hypothetical protein HMPREF1354_00927 [Enterococcus faecium 514]EJY37952.1 hypothetical protein HMPREF1352_00878 [Enterococcus faecium 511]